MRDGIILETKGITKRFRGLVAVDRFDIAVRERTIHSLIGPNGAGKTTVFNVITGIYRPEEGKVLFEGQAIGRGLMRSPKLMLLDEPSLGLAPLLVDQVFATIVQINKEGVPILIVEQNARKALGIADQAYV